MHKFCYEEVPSYRLKEFFSKKTRYCFMPVIYNEGEKFLRHAAPLARHHAEFRSIGCDKTEVPTEPVALHLRDLVSRCVENTELPSNRQQPRFECADQTSVARVHIHRRAEKRKAACDGKRNRAVFIRAFVDINPRRQHPLVNQKAADDVQQSFLFLR